jgi:threonine/homoserine/homoserine lactone efflux protein
MDFDLYEKILSDIKVMGRLKALKLIATVSIDVIGTVSYGFGGAALARRMTDPRFRKRFSVAVAVVLIAAAGLIVSRA